MSFSKDGVLFGSFLMYIVNCNIKYVMKMCGGFT